MARGRPAHIVTKKEVQLIVKTEIEKALTQLDIKTTLIGAKRKGRPIGFRLKKKSKH